MARQDLSRTARCSGNNRRRHTTSLHTFPNTPHDDLQYQAGAVHVAIGFVDLSPLVMGDLVGESDDPLCWVGYEASAHSVAKALVINEMLRAGTSPRDVVFTCYSSVWTHTGSAAFIAAVHQVLSRGQCAQTVTRRCQVPRALAYPVPHGLTKRAASGLRSPGAS